MIGDALLNNVHVVLRGFIPVLSVGFACPIFGLAQVAVAFKSEGEVMGGFAFGFGIASSVEQIIPNFGGFFPFSSLGEAVGLLHGVFICALGGRVIGTAHVDPNRSNPFAITIARFSGEFAYCGELRTQVVACSVLGIACRGIFVRFIGGVFIHHYPQFWIVHPPAHVKAYIPPSRMGVFDDFGAVFLFGFVAGLAVRNVGGRIK